MGVGNFYNFGISGMRDLGFWDLGFREFGMLGFWDLRFGDLELWVLLVLEVCGFWDFYSGVFV